MGRSQSLIAKTNEVMMRVRWKAYFFCYAAMCFILTKECSHFYIEKAYIYRKAVYAIKCN